MSIGGAYLPAWRKAMLSMIVHFIWSSLPSVVFAMVHVLAEILGTSCVGPSEATMGEKVVPCVIERSYAVLYMIMISL